MTARMPFLYRASLNKWWFDDLNHLLFIVIGGRIAARLWWFDRNVVDGTVNGIGALTVGAGRGLRRVQTGRVQNYALGHRPRADRDGRLVPHPGGPLTMNVDRPSRSCRSSCSCRCSARSCSAVLPAR